MRYWGCLWVLLLAMPAVGYEIKPFPHSEIQHEEQKTLDSYRLVLSSSARAEDSANENELRLPGDLWRRTWAVESQFSLAEVTTFFKKQIENIPILFHCRALDCGSSYFWANELFSNARLVGRAQHQNYYVGVEKGAAGKANKVYVLYIIQRGTKQVMVHLDVLTTQADVQAATSPTAQIKQQLKLSSGWLSGFVTQKNTLNKEASHALIQSLNGLTPRSKKRIFLLTHCYASHDMDNNMACSKQLAQELNDTLEGEFTIIGQGALTAPPSKEVTPALRFIYWPSK